MKNRFITAALFACAMVAASSCTFRVNSEKFKEELGYGKNSISIEVSGDKITKEINLDAFKEVSSKGSFDVSFYYSDSAKVVITAAENVIDKISVEQKGSTVEVKFDKNVRIGKSSGTKVEVYGPCLETIGLAGSGDINIDEIHEHDFKAAVAGSGDINIDMLKADEAQLAVAGSGDIKAVVDVNVLKISVAGSGDAIISGKANKFEGGVAGAGDLDVSELECDDVDAGVKGSGKVRRK